MVRYTYVLILAILFWSCETNEDSPESEGILYYNIIGEAQGTTYSITFQGDLDATQVKFSVDSLLDAYDQENSIYKPNSLIVSFNESFATSFDLDSFSNNSYFQTCFHVAKEVYQLTDGAFNPAVYPLVNYWGFHKENFNYEPDSLVIQQLLQLIDFSNANFRLEAGKVIRTNPEAKIDFNALAQGHSVDVVGNYLKNLGVENFMVEIGGEIRCNGYNPDQSLWKVGIEKPVDNSETNQNELQLIAAFSNKSMATSGNYRKFYEINGQKYAHTIDPVSGYPAMQNLLSVTVITDECIYADAFATAFMVLGLDKSIEFIENHPDLAIEAYFVYDNEGQLETTMTEGFDQFILKQ